MSEREPQLTVDLERIGKVEMTRHNSGLFTFLGQTAFNGIIYDNPALDHIYMRLPEEHEMTGVYLFKTMTPRYNQIAGFMVQNNYPLALNHQTVPESDIATYERMLERQQERYKEEIPDFLPENFR